MTTTTMLSADHSARRGGARGNPRRTVRRPVVDLAPWIAPVLWMAALAVFVTGVGAVALMRDGVPSGTPATMSVKVSPSDTLWSIAEANRIPGTSTAATIETITRVNGLRGGALKPGSILRVPAANGGGSAFAQVDSGDAARQ
jgi:hypothetical protein